MRDPARIPALIHALMAAWTKFPDLRLGQLVIVAASREDDTVDPFYVEDDVTLAGLRRLAGIDGDEPPPDDEDGSGFKSY